MAKKGWEKLTVLLLQRVPLGSLPPSISEGCDEIQLLSCTFLPRPDFMCSSAKQSAWICILPAALLAVLASIFLQTAQLAGHLQHWPNHIFSSAGRCQACLWSDWHAVACTHSNAHLLSRLLVLLLGEMTGEGPGGVGGTAVAIVNLESTDPAALGAGEGPRSSGLCSESMREAEREACSEPGLPARMGVTLLASAMPFSVGRAGSEAEALTCASAG